MTPVSILADLAAAGAAASLDGDRLLLRGKRPPDALLDAVRQHKAGLIEYLRSAATEHTTGTAKPPVSVTWWPISQATIMLDPPPVCARCGGNNWWRPRPGGFFHCLACNLDHGDDPPPPPKVPPAQRKEWPTAFLMPAKLLPPKEGTCQCCHKARWAWSPSNPMATASDGWRRWVCANCLWEEAAYPDVVIFEPAKLREDKT